MTAKDAAPIRSLEQRMDALGRANEIRMARAKLKVVVRADYSLKVLIDIIVRPEAARQHLPAKARVAAPPGFVGTMRVYDLILGARGFGKVAANKLLTRARIAPSKTIGGLSERQRRELVVELDAIARRRASDDPAAHTNGARVADPINPRSAAA